MEDEARKELAWLYGEDEFPHQRSRGLPFGCPPPPRFATPAAQFATLQHQQPMAESPASNSNGGPSPPAGAPAVAETPNSKTHKRTYQACMACRDRKVKCNLGHPDNPEPPCARCKRESKHCYFSSTRRKNYKANSETPVVEEVRPVKRAKTGNLSTTLPDSNGTVPPRPRTPGGSESLVQPLRPRERGTLSGDIEEDDPEVIEDTAEVLQKTEIHHGPDALGLLSTVALAAHSSYRGRTQSSGSLPRFNREMSGIHTGFMAANSPKQALDSSRGVAANSPFTPDNKTANPDLEGLEKSRLVWSKMRFVRSGIFTVQEGMDYLNYFYQYLNPLTPVTVPRFQDPATHAKLLEEEPILAVTMLTIASRYMQPKGPAATSRSYRIHDALWSYLSQQIERLIFGQEQFGGGFCGAGTKKRMTPGGPRGLRTLGTVESLLLLTEWHARALHFPPGADSEELLQGDSNATPADDNEDDSDKHVGGWLEPCWRSDRMVWSMLAIAQSLAAELGVFDKIPSTDVPYNDPTLVEEYFRRKENARRLLFIYITQTSGRLSLPSIISDSLCHDMFPNGAPLTGKNQPRRVSTGTIPYYQIQETVLYFWHEIAVLFADGNKKLFASREKTRSIISSGEYVELLAQFESSAQQWQREFQACTVIPQHMRHILTIEFEYASIYVNSIGLQAIINRCIKVADSGAISPGTLLEMLQGDRIYLEAILRASQKFLRAVVDGLLPEKYLKHSPVRTYLRIISVCMMLLKTFALGAMGSEVSTLLELLDRSTRALRDCVVDDVHIGSSVAELIGVLTNRARSRMIRIKSSTDRDKKSSDVRKNASQTRAHQQSQGPSFNTHSANSNQIQQYSPAQYPGSATSNQHPTLQSPPQFTHSPANNHHPSPIYDHPSNFSIMPPSTWTPDGYFGANNANNGMPQQQNHSNTGNGNEYQHAQAPGQDQNVNYDFMDFSAPGAEWAALPLDNIFQGGGGGDFTQTGYGLELGGRDMLDVLLMDEINSSNGQ